MARGKTFTVLLLVGTVAGALIWRRRSARKERIDLYFADGSMVSVEEGALDAERLLPLARGVLDATRETR